jgi:hypothetical protein
LTALYVSPLPPTFTPDSSSNYVHRGYFYALYERGAKQDLQHLAVYMYVHPTVADASEQLDCARDVATEAERGTVTVEGRRAGEWVLCRGDRGD